MVLVFFFGIRLADSCKQLSPALFIADRLCFAQASQPSYPIEGTLHPFQVQNAFLGVANPKQKSNIFPLSRLGRISADGASRRIVAIIL